MNYQEKYQKARQANYSDEEITQYLLEKDPAFEQKIQKAKEIGYSPEEILNFLNKPKESELGDYVEDFGKQTTQGFGIGALGTYGDILDLFGLQSKETLPGEKEKYNREFDEMLTFFLFLNKMEGQAIFIWDID